jgi:hypothetical protein
MSSHKWHDSIKRNFQRILWGEGELQSENYKNKVINKTSKNNKIP